MCKCKKMLKYILIGAGAVITVAGIISAAVNKSRADEDENGNKKGGSVFPIVFGLLCAAAGGVMWLGELFGDNFSRIFETGREKLASVIPEKQPDWADIACELCKFREKTEDVFSNLESTVSNIIKK